MKFCPCPQLSLPACVTLKPAIVFKAKYRGGNARVGCLCVTQQSFAQGCSPLPYILPPNRLAWPSCLHGNAYVYVCVSVCAVRSKLSPPSSPLVRQRDYSLPPLLLLYLECFSGICVLSLLSVYNSDLCRVCFYLSLSSIPFFLLISLLISISFPFDMHANSLA